MRWLWLLLVGWLLVPVGFGVWHRGPGQDRVRLDEVGNVLARGDGHAGDKQWAEAIQAYDEALRLLPAEQVATARRIRLARAQARMNNNQLTEAHDSLKALCGEMQADAAADRAVLADARSALAQTHYYRTWVLRLQGRRALWEPEVETARQTYRLLAEQASERGDESARQRHQQDLETAVRLARQDIEELLRKPGPGGIGSIRVPGKAKAQGQAPVKDAREASSGPPPDTGGH